MIGLTGWCYCGVLLDVLTRCHDYAVTTGWQVDTTQLTLHKQDVDKLCFVGLCNSVYRDPFLMEKGVF